jgi:hypothetical protein
MYDLLKETKTNFTQQWFNKQYEFIKKQLNHK